MITKQINVHTARWEEVPKRKTKQEEKCMHSMHVAQQWPQMHPSVPPHHGTTLSLTLNSNSLIVFNVSIGTQLSGLRDLLLVYTG